MDKRGNMDRHHGNAERGNTESARGKGVRGQHGPAHHESEIVAQRRKGIYILPSLFTTASLFAAFYAIVQAMQGNFELAPVAIFISMVLDALDGRVARLT